MLKGRRAQSTVEYALLAAAVILAVVYGANSVIKAKVKANMDTSDALLDKANYELQTATGVETP